MIVYYLDDTNPISIGTFYMVNDITPQAYVYSFGFTALFPPGEKTLKVQILCPDAITVNGTWGIVKLHGIPDTF